MLVRSLLGMQHGLPNILKVPPVALVTTQVLYRVRVRMPQAVTGRQQEVVSGYRSVPDPMENTTGALIVADVGNACAITMQYLQPF